MVSEESPACSKSSQGGYFKGEIIPVEAPQADGSVITVDSDQSIRPDTSLEKIASLPPAFKPGGVITAGNSSPLNAGATGLLLASKRKVAETWAGTTCKDRYLRHSRSSTLRDV